MIEDRTPAGVILHIVQKPTVGLPPKVTRVSVLNVIGTGHRDSLPTYAVVQNGFFVGAAGAGSARSAAQPPGSRAQTAGHDETLHDPEEQVRQRVRRIAGSRHAAGAQDRPDRRSAG